MISKRFLRLLNHFRAGSSSAQPLYPQSEVVSEEYQLVVRFEFQTRRALLSIKVGQIYVQLRPDFP